MTTYTRQDYLNGQCTHAEYYGQFVTERIKNIVKKRIGFKRIKESTDEHLNDIELSEWDAIVFLFQNSTDLRMRACGDYLTAAGGVCIAKEAARQLLQD